MSAEPRRAPAAFALSDASGQLLQRGEAEAVIGDDVLVVGPVSASLIDIDVVSAADYRIELTLWPSGRLDLSNLGRRFDTFSQELRRIRNRARVAGLLAHGVEMPAVFSGAVLGGAAQLPAEIQLYETHVTVVPADGDPWQIPLGAITVVRFQSEPPAVVLESAQGLTTLGQLARHREACQAMIAERWEAQRSLLRELTGHSGFSDGCGVRRVDLRDFDILLERFTSPDRAACRNALLEAATHEPRLGFVRLLDPDGERLQSPSPLPENWASFLLVPVGSLTVLEILAGPAAATYLFRGEIGAVNRDLQLLHFRRALLALPADDALVTPDNPHRLALRKLEPLQRLRAATTARLFHTDGWESALRSAI